MARTSNAFSTGRRCLAALVLLALIAGAAAQSTAAASNAAPAHNKGSKVLTKCGKLTACATCTKSGRSLTCLSCRGDAELVSGRCNCPAGYGQTGTANTARGSTSTARGGKSSARNSCSLCAAGSYSDVSKPVGTARCKRCPLPSMAPDQGATTCIVAAGLYNNNGVVEPCPADNYCLGGPLSGTTGPPLTPCPAGTGTNTLTGQDAQSDCSTVLPGFYNNNGVVEPCPADNYCLGGPLSGTTGPPLTPCPAGTGTNTLTGQDAQSDCDYVQPGYYFDPNSGPSGAVLDCPADSYCPGGPLNGQGQSITTCPLNSESLQNSDVLADCWLKPGYVCVFANNVCTPTQCPANSYCPGGDSVTDQAATGSQIQCSTVSACTNPCTAASPAGSDGPDQCFCSCPSCGPNQISVNSVCVCQVGYFGAPNAQGELYCTSCELATGIAGSSNTQAGETTQGSCSTCTYGFSKLGGSTCQAVCNAYIPNSNSTLPGPTVSSQCDICAIGFYNDDADNTGSATLTAGDNCVACPNGGYGTGLIGSCTTQCNYDKYYDSGACLPCPNGRITDPNAPLGSSNNAGVQVCLCPPGSYFSDGDYSNTQGVCFACSPALTGDGLVYKTVPAYGAISNNDCKVACGPGYKQTSATRCFKCQNIDSWSPGGLVDPTGPAECYDCSAPGYIAAYIDSNGDAICNASGVNGNQACIPCNGCLAGTVPNSYTCTPPAKRLF